MGKVGKRIKTCIHKISLSEHQNDGMTAGSSLAKRTKRGEGEQKSRRLYPNRWSRKFGNDPVLYKKSRYYTSINYLFLKSF